MRKYYKLQKDNEWSKGWNIIEFILQALLGKIKLFDTIWHTGLCPRKKQHPNLCIHDSVQAREIKYLPNWILQPYYGLPQRFAKIKKYIKSNLGKKDSYKAFVSKPLEMPDFLAEDAVCKILLPSIRAINNLCSGGRFSIELKFTTLDDPTIIVNNVYPIVFKVTEPNYLYFEIKLPVPPNVGGVLHQESYGLHRVLNITSDHEHLRVMSNSVTNFSTKFPFQPQILKGQFTQINQVVKSNYNSVYLRLIIPINSVAKKDFISPLHIFERSKTIIFDKEEFNIDDSIMGVKFRAGGAYTEVIINKKTYHFYTIQKHYLIIECININDLETFKLESEQIRLVYSLLCGNFYRGEKYYISSYNDDFSSIEGVWYEKELPNIITNYQIIDPSLFFTTYNGKNEEYKEKYKEYHTKFPSEIFIKLVHILLAENDIQRAIKLLINGSGSEDPIQKGALYAVAIETLTSYLTTKNFDNLKPIKDSKVEKEILNKIENIINEYDSQLDLEGLEILKKKINTLNAPTNRNKLIKPFEIYGISLSDDNIKAIDKRNSYLHGRSPLKSEDEFELNNIALELHYLASCLILKYSGYKGHVIYLPNWLIISDEEKLADLMIKRLQQQMDLYALMNEAAEQNDEQAFAELKTQLIEFLNKHEINNVIMII